MTERLQVADVSPFSQMSPAEEHELTSLYRTHYPDLLVRAQAALGEELGNFSGKIAQQSMLAAWSTRAAHATPEAFTNALHEAVEHEAATQRRKHAALHQRDGQMKRSSHLNPLSVDDAVAQLVATLHAPPADHAEAANAAKAAGKRHAAEHVQYVARRRSWKGPAALVVVLGIAIVGVMQWTQATGETIAVKKALAADNARTLSATRGQRGNVDLADGTKARIGSDSKLRLPNAFGTTMRTVEVEGSVSFTVAAGQSMPFSVWARNATITATGTRFTVRAFEDDASVVVGVEEGSVLVRAKEARDELAVSAGQAARVSPDGSIALLDDAMAKDYALAWVRDSLAFTNTPAKVVLSELVRWFGLEASLADSSLGSRPVTMRLGLQSSGDAVAAFAKAADLAIGFDKDDKVVLSAAAAKAPTK
ncbi:MAG: FecR domain-containing protein [Gemmatimonadaceae bacterium]|nr:FecR domain-containing protein [Gemmatimonadaceae bacterium]